MVGRSLTCAISVRNADAIRLGVNDCAVAAIDQISGTHWLLHAGPSGFASDKSKFGSCRWSQGPQIHMPVHVLIEEVTEPSGAASVARLGTKGAEPHVVSGFDLDPVLVEPIDRLAFKNI